MLATYYTSITKVKKSLNLKFIKYLHNIFDGVN